MKELNIRVMTPDRIIYEGKIASLHAPGMYGYFTVLPDHTPYVAILKNDELIIETLDNKTVYVAVASAILEVEKNEVSIMAQCALVGQARNAATQQMVDDAKAREEENKHARIQNMRTEVELYRLIQQANKQY